MACQSLLDHKQLLRGAYSIEITPSLAVKHLSICVELPSMVRLGAAAVDRVLSVRLTVPMHCSRNR